jgi:AsmA protein
MRNKVLTLDPFEFGMAGGKVAGVIKMDGQKDPIAGSTSLRVKDLELPKLFPTIKEGQASMGDINGLIELSGSGASVGEMLGSSNGKVGLFLDGGKISRFMMELAALDLWGVARVKLKGDEPVEIRCAIADFAVKDGMMRTNAFVFDTEVVNINGTGTVNLKTEALDLTLKPEPKDRSLASLNSPLYVRGTFGAPKPSADYKRMTTKGIGALVMGVLNPVLAVLPLMQEGKGKDSPCAQLIAHATDPKARSKPPVDPAGAGGSAPPKRREGQQLPKTD